MAVYRLNRGTTTVSSWLAGVEITMLTTTGVKTERRRTLPCLAPRRPRYVPDRFQLRPTPQPVLVHKLRANARATIVADGPSREIVAHARNHQVPVLSRQPLP